MRIIRTLTRNECTRALNFTNHTNHFSERINRLTRTGMGIGKVVSGFLVDKDHENGLEEHYITTTGLVVIRNHNTHKAITVLVARPAQIDRYYYNVSDTVMPVVAAIKNIAKYNCEVCHYNY